MFFVRQAILLVLVGAAFALLLGTYRKQNAVEESFLCGILLMLAGCVMPDALLFFPVVWWGFTVLWSDSLRVYLASVCAIMLVGLYVALIWLLLPDCPLTLFIQDNIFSAFIRTPFYRSANIPICQLIIAAVAVFFGLWTLFAHLSRYSRANVRTQNFLLVTIPFFLLSILSVFFPADNGNDMLSILVGTTLFLIGLYLKAYGFPRFRLPRRQRTGLRNRKWKHRKSPYKM